MTIMGVYGLPGYGKSLFATDLLEHASKKGIPLFANLKGFKLPVTFLTIEAFQKLETENAVVYVDEPYKWGLDSRASSSVLNRAQTSTIGEARKSGFDILYTTQIPTEADKRLRFKCRSVFVALPPVPDKYYQYKYIGRVTKTVSIPWKRAKVLYELYDTWEHVEIAEEDDVVPLNDVPLNRDPEGEGYTATEDGVRIYK